MKLNESLTANVKTPSAWAYDGWPIGYFDSKTVASVILNINQDTVGSDIPYLRPVVQKLTGVGLLDRTIDQVTKGSRWDLLWERWMRGEDQFDYKYQVILEKTTLEEAERFALLLRDLKGGSVILALNDFTSRMGTQTR